MLIKKKRRSRQEWLLKEEGITRFMVKPYFRAERLSV